ncbi:MAG: hypothetical protein ACMVY4_09690 [Minwuia sp.]|uniref:hypothetical protein n=1 Tax=Minwuia sp. TaxID=2493630 RepID=UPI003A86E3B4
MTRSPISRSAGGQELQPWLVNSSTTVSGLSPAAAGWDSQSAAAAKAAIHVVVFSMGRT